MVFTRLFVLGGWWETEICFLLSNVPVFLLPCAASRTGTMWWKRLFSSAGVRLDVTVCCKSADENGCCRTTTSEVSQWSIVRRQITLCLSHWMNCESRFLTSFCRRLCNLSESFPPERLSSFDTEKAQVRYSRRPKGLLSLECASCVTLASVAMVKIMMLLLHCTSDITLHV